MTPKMTQHGAQLGHFGGSLGSKNSLKNETQKHAQKRGSGFYKKHAVGPGTVKEYENYNKLGIDISRNVDMRKVKFCTLFCGSRFGDGFLVECIVSGGEGGKEKNMNRRGTVKV